MIIQYAVKPLIAVVIVTNLICDTIGQSNNKTKDKIQNRKQLFPA